MKRLTLCLGAVLAVLCACLAPVSGYARSPDAALERGLSGVISAIEGDRPDVALQRGKKTVLASQCGCPRLVPIWVATQRAFFAKRCRGNC